MCTTTCRTAIWPLCRCECNYTNHGVERADPLFEAPLERAPRRPSRRTAQMFESDVDGWYEPRLLGLALDDIETWLDQHVETRDDVVRIIAMASPSEAHPAVGDVEHTACAVLVSVVIALEQIDDLRDQVVEEVAETITRSALTALGQDPRVAGPLDTIAEQALVAAVERVVKLVVDATLPRTALVDQEMLLALRLAAVLACPDPDEHRDVHEHCVEPLALAVIDVRGSR